MVWYCSQIIILLMVFLVSLISHINSQISAPLGFNQDSSSLPPCASCKVLVESFKKGIDKTSRNKFEGGDTAWEEDKLGSYKTSEVRLVEIQEHLCNDLKKGKDQCHALADELENLIEDWWFKKQDTNPDLYTYLCIESAKRCCEKDKYGPDCEQCPGYPDNVCSNNGKCKGAGTRKGNGKCNCDKGYKGDMCFECSDGYYQSYKDDKKLLCSRCHPSCNGTCSGGGANECFKCNDGWNKIEGQGCTDINECLQKGTCKKNEFCVNTDGSYSCLACDKACDGCTGDGPDMCKKCAEGHRKDGTMCLNADILGRKSKENYYRYGTYVGLGMATCIILQRNIYVAAIIGLVVAAYISVSEYMIANTAIQDTIPNIELLNKDL